MSGISTHVLDVANGAPAVGVKVRVERLSDGAWELIGDGETDPDGRCRDLGQAIALGVYRLSFDSGSYFATSNRPTLYPEIAVSFQVNEAGGRYHIPVLLSPFGYTTYRGT